MRILSIHRTVLLFLGILSSVSHATIDERDVDFVIEKTEQAYSKILRNRKKILVFYKITKSPYHDAFVELSGAENHRIEISLHGGLWRHPKINDAALTLAICHELGHVFGYRTGLYASEIEADIYASGTCFDRVGIGNIHDGINRLVTVFRRHRDDRKKIYLSGMKK